MVDNKYGDQNIETKTTGHEWDGIKELDNPDPFWLRGLFYVALFFALGYWMLYPSWPTPNSQGLLNWSAYSQLEESLEELEDIRKIHQAKFDKASFKEILKDPELLKFANAGGKSAFENNCAVCHGSGGHGNKGYPNLTAGAWLWGGSIEDIHTTIKYGIRSTHDETRDSQMAAFGKDKILKAKEVEMLANYVLSLKNGRKTGTKADKLFQEHCASCHGNKGQGGRDFGAPKLNDSVWLYGQDYDSVFDVIYNGRAGVMPYWSTKLSDSTIKQLAVYVHQLGGGE